MTASFNSVVLVVGFLSILEHDNTCSSRLVSHSSQDNHLCAEGFEFCKELVNVCLIVLFLVLHSGEHAGFSDIREDDICLCTELFHLFNIGHIECRIENSSIGHCRVNDV